MKIIKNTLSFVLNLPWTLEFLILALISVPIRIKINREPFAFVVHVKNLWWAKGYMSGARGAAMGNVVLLSPNIKKGDLEHELVHIEQFQREPLIHPILSALELLKKGYRNNKYEVEAYSRAGNIFGGLRGVIIKESLTDVSILKRFYIARQWNTNDLVPSDGWHLYFVECRRNEVNKLSNFLQHGPWYAHFWKEGRMVVVFKERIFEFEMTGTETRQKAIAYGMSVGIPEEQLDFTVQDIF